MFRNVFLKSFRDQFVPVAAWGLGLAAMAYILILFFPAMDALGELDQLLAEFPQLAGFLGDVASLTTLEGYVTSQLLAFMPVILSIYGILAAVSMVTGEVDTGTIYFLMAHPVSRERVIVQKYLALVLSIVVICLLMGIGLWLGGITIGEGLPFANWMLAAINVIPITLFYSSLAFLLACALRSRGIAIAIATALAVVGFILNGLAPLVEGLNDYRELTIYYLFTASKPLTGEVRLDHVGILLVLSLLCAVLGVYLFSRRDILA